jgi:putative transposase
MRKIKFITGERYHVFNRGVDKRIIFKDTHDAERFFQTMKLFNTIEPNGCLYLISLNKDKRKSEPLVHFITHSLQSNHFHFVIEQAVENGVSTFMKRLIGGYVGYFNNKYKRSGCLFQGPYKGSYIHSNEYLLYVSAYVNLNDQQNECSDQVATVGYSSWKEYIENSSAIEDTFCTHKNIILDQFQSPEDYKKYALSVLEEVKFNKERYKLLGL